MYKINVILAKLLCIDWIGGRINIIVLIIILMHCPHYPENVPPFTVKLILLSKIKNCIEKKIFNKFMYYLVFKLPAK